MMTASATVVTDVALSPEAFLDRPPAFSPFCRLSSPRISLGRDLAAPGKAEESPPDAEQELGGGGGGGGDFEFRLHDPVAMLHADELFADGKLVPLQLAAAKRGATARSPAGIRSPEQPKARRRDEVLGSDPYVFSPRAPSCTSRWRELLGLRRAAGPKPDLEKASAVARAKNPNAEARSLKHFFQRNPKLSVLEPSLSLPLLRDSDSESIAISGRFSLSSSSSSGPDHDDLPRLSLDIDRSNHHTPALRLVRRPPPTAEPGRSRIRRALSSEVAPPPPPITGIAVPADSPRMNPSGKVVFHGLERSSSSPGSFTGGPRPRLRGMERSYSANVVRVTNVPVCSLRGSAKAGPVFGFGQLFSPSPQKKEKSAAASSGTTAARPGGSGGGGKGKGDKASNSQGSGQHSRFE